MWPLPDAGFYLWAKVPEALGMTDTEFARALLAQYNVTVLPGSYLAREAQGSNPGAQRVRMALVADTRRMRGSRAAHRPIHPIPYCLIP
jgi:N-succinyldiaminopimelate aminotransferase